MLDPVTSSMGWQDFFVMDGSVKTPTKCRLWRCTLDKAGIKEGDVIRLRASINVYNNSKSLSLNVAPQKIDVFSPDLADSPDSADSADSADSPLGAFSKWFFSIDVASVIVPRQAVTSLSEAMTQSTPSGTPFEGNVVVVSCDDVKDTSTGSKMRKIVIADPSYDDVSATIFGNGAVLFDAMTASANTDAETDASRLLPVVKLFRSSACADVWNGKRTIKIWCNSPLDIDIVDISNVEDPDFRAWHSKISGAQSELLSSDFTVARIQGLNLEEGKDIYVNLGNFLVTQFPDRETTSSLTWKRNVKVIDETASLPLDLTLFGQATAADFSVGDVISLSRFKSKIRFDSYVGANVVEVNSPLLCLGQSIKLHTFWRNMQQTYDEEKQGGQAEMHQHITGDGLLVDVDAIPHLANGCRVRVILANFVDAFGTLYLRGEETNVVVSLCSSATGGEVGTLAPDGKSRVSLFNARVAERGIVRLDSASRIEFS